MRKIVNVESLSGHIPRSSLRSSDLLPFYHQYPAACCGEFLLARRALVAIVSHDAVGSYYANISP